MKKNVNFIESKFKSNFDGKEYEEADGLLKGIKNQKEIDDEEIRWIQSVHQLLGNPHTRGFVEHYAMYFRHLHFDVFGKDTLEENLNDWRMLEMLRDKRVIEAFGDYEAMRERLVKEGCWSDWANKWTATVGGGGVVGGEAIPNIEVSQRLWKHRDQLDGIATQKDRGKEIVFELLISDPLDAIAKLQGDDPTKFYASFSSLVERALGPLYDTIAAIAAESGIKKHFKHENPVVVEGVKDLKDFKAKNTHLSEAVGLFVHKDNKFQPIGARYYPYEQRIERYVLLFNTLDGIEFAPRLIWCMLGDEAFRFMLQNTTYGALELAANELGYPLKDLVMSEHVNFMFAQFVARKFISPKQNAYVAGANAASGAMYRISSGFNTSVQANSKWLMGCKKWFAECIYKPAFADELERLKELREDADHGSNLWEHYNHFCVCLEDQRILVHPSSGGKRLRSI